MALWKKGKCSLCELKFIATGSVTKGTETKVQHVNKLKNWYESVLFIL